MNKTEDQINVQELHPQIRHATIFEKFNNLEAGEAFVIIYDHDPKPLGYQMAALAWTGCLQLGVFEARP